MKRRLLFVALTVLGTAVLAFVSSLLLSNPAVFASEAAGQVGALAGEGGSQLGYVAVALSTGLSALGAAYAVGSVAGASVGALAEKPELFGRLLILVGLAEGIAIYGVIISVLILNRLV
jgi:V/A-type H+/Na+-transporting ATPase subunit K